MYGAPGRTMRLATNRRTSIKSAIRRASQRARQRMFRLDRRMMGLVARAYRDALDEIRADLQQEADEDGSISARVMDRLIAQAEAQLDRLTKTLIDELNGGLAQAATLGVEPMTQARIATDLQRLADEAVRFVTHFIAEDGLQLSDRLWRIDNHAREIVSSAIRRAVVQGQSAQQAAMDLLARGERIPPQLMKKMTIAQWDSIASDIQRGLITGEGSAMYNAQRLFRTEINRAHGEAYQSAVFEHPDVIGTRFLLSPSHPRTDICDMHASVNRYGLGPGVYPKGRNPWPAHPNTLSFVEVVFRDEVSDDDRRKKEDRISWLKRQPSGVQAGVLGSRRKAAALRRGWLKREGEIVTPWREIKKKLERRGHDIAVLR